MEVPINRIGNCRSFVYNIFIAGLAFNSMVNMVGMILNPASVISVNGFFYIVGVLVYTVALTDAIRSFSEERSRFNKIRVIIKASLMAFMVWSPVPLFAAMALIDAAIMSF